MCNWYIHTLRYLYHIMVILDDDFYTPEKCVMSSFPLPHCAPVPPTKTWKYYNCCCRGGSKGPLGPPNFKYPSGYGTGYQTATLMMLQGTGEGCHTSPPPQPIPRSVLPNNGSMAVDVAALSINLDASAYNAPPPAINAPPPQISWGENKGGPWVSYWAAPIMTRPPSSYI